MEMKEPTLKDVFYRTKLNLPLLLFLPLFVTVCHGNKVQAGIIYDVSTEIFPSIIEEQVNAYSSSASPQINWLLINSSSATNVLRRVRSFIGSGIHVLISQLRCRQLTSVSAMTTALQIPHLALHIGTCKVSRNITFTIHLENQFYYLPKMIISIAQLERWKKVIFILNNNFVQRYAQLFIKELSKAGIECVLWNGEYLELWTDRHPIILIVKNLSSIPQKVMSTQPSPGGRSWIILSDGDVTNTSFAQVGSFLQGDSLLIRPKVLCSHNQFINICNNTGFKFLPKHMLRILLQTASLGLNLRSNKSNVTNTDDGEESFCVGADYLLDWTKQNLRLLRESETKVIKDVCSGDFELLKLSKDHKSIQVAGEWTLAEGLSKYEDSRSLVKEDFKGITLQVGVVQGSAPFSYVTVGGHKKYEGLAIDILDHVAMDLNFRYVVKEPADGLYGHPLDNGTWTGTIGMIHREEIAFGAGLFTVNMERYEVVDYTTSFMATSFGILTSNEKGQTGNFQFVKTFTRKVWGIIILFGITTTIALFLMTGLTEPKRNADNQILTRMDIVFDVIAAFLEQGVLFWSRSRSARCLLVFWVVFSLLVVAIYTAHLTAVLTISTPIKHINNLKDLSEKSDLDVISVDGTSAWMLFQLSKETVNQKIFRRLQTATAAQDENDILQRVYSGKACYIRGAFYLQYLVSLSCGKARLAEEQFQHQTVAFPIQKNSPFKKAIDHSLQHMVEAGFIDLLKKKWLNQPVYCTKDTKDETTMYRLNIERLWGVFLTFVGFVEVALISCFVERILFHAARK